MRSMSLGNSRSFTSLLSRMTFFLRNLHLPQWTGPGAIVLSHHLCRDIGEEYCQAPSAPPYFCEPLERMLDRRI